MMTTRSRWCAVLVVLLLPVPAQPEAPPVGELPLSAAEQREVVQGICREVEARYVLPDVARTMSAHVLDRLAQGAYAGLTSPADLAERLQADLREVSKDRHLFVDCDPREVEDLRAAAAAGGAETPSGDELKASRLHNFGLRGIGILAGNVGYLDLRDFEHPNLSGTKIAAAMAFLADCDAMIVDLRSNGGGWSSTTALLASYFFAPGRPIHFTDFHDRLKGETEQSWTLPFVPGRTLSSQPLFVLVSERTFSGAEEFAYNLQALKRATVVGEQTRGGANNPESAVINDDFVLWVPQGRPSNPITKTNWEGRGVTPDIQVAEKQALEVAHQMALERLLAAGASAPDSFRLQWDLDGQKARVNPVKPDPRDLRACAGTYGSLRVILENGVLYVQNVDRPRQALIPLAPGLVGIEGRDDQRLRFVREDGRVTGVVVLNQNGTSRTRPRTSEVQPPRK
jgi:retinol-binding protein 3